MAARSSTQMPERIPDTPQNIFKAVLAGPPKKDWKYLRETGRKQSEPKLFRAQCVRLHAIPIDFVLTIASNEVSDGRTVVKWLADRIVSIQSDHDATG